MLIRGRKPLFIIGVIFTIFKLIIIFYSSAEIEQYINIFRQKRAGSETNNNDIKLDSNYNNLVLTQLSDSQILSLVLYEIEKKYHFSGDGIWAGQDGVRVDSRNT